MNAGGARNQVIPSIWVPAVPAVRGALPVVGGPVRTL